MVQQIENKIVIYKQDGVEENYYKLEKLEEERDLFQIELDKLKADVRVKLDKIEKLGNLTWDEDCEHCMSNPFTLDELKLKRILRKIKHWHNNMYKRNKRWKMKSKLCSRFVHLKKI